MKILSKKALYAGSHAQISEVEIFSPDIARSARAGQFVALMTCEEGERIPLTIVDCDKTKGSIKLIFQEAGLTTMLLGKMNPGESLYALVGPLGHSTDIKSYGKVILIGGGVGIAELYPVAKALKDAGNEVTAILGARTKDALILEREMTKTSDYIYITTDNGSYGKKGFVTDVLKELLSYTLHPTPYTLVYAVGPIPMMRSISEATNDKKIHTIVSLNALMVDATGMCGCCRVTIGGKVKFSCVDGPEFDSHLVDWDELIKRNNIYLDKEKHICNLKKHL